MSRRYGSDGMDRSVEGGRLFPGLHCVGRNRLKSRMNGGGDLSRTVSPWSTSHRSRVIQYFGGVASQSEELTWCVGNLKDVAIRAGDVHVRPCLFWRPTASRHLRAAFRSLGTWKVFT